MLIPWLILALELSGEHDKELARRLQRREPGAMDDLYKKYGKLAYSIIFAVVRDTGVAEDLAQETFLRVWTRIQAFEAGRGALGPWLLAIARNRAIDHVRSSGARMGRGTVELDSNAHPSLFVDLDRQIFDKDHAKVVRAAIAKLGDNQREVIRLAYYEGLSQTEMADKLGQPLGTVKTWVRSALKVLRAELGQEAAA